MGNNLNYMRRRFGIESQPHLVTDSGLLVSFNTGFSLPLKKLVVGIEPVQDLHGQSNPYPAGGGVNKWEPFSGTSRGIDFTPQSDGTVKIAGTMSSSGWPQVSKDFTLAELGLSIGDSIYVYADGGISSAIRFFDSSSQQISQISYMNSGTVPVDTAVVRIIQIGDAGSTAPSQGDVINKVGKFEFVKGSTAPTAWSPYSNICPITGWTGCNVSRTGKNLLPNKKYQRSTTYVYLGQDVSQSNYVLPLKAGTYSFKCDNSTNANLYFKERDDSSSTRVTSSAYTNISETITLPKDGLYQLWLYLAGGFSAENVTKFQLEIGESSTDYEPYSGTTYPISWQTEAGTVYGGELDVTTGVLKVTHAQVTYDGSQDESWVRSSAIGMYFIEIPDMKSGKYLQDGRANWLKTLSVSTQFGIQFGIATGDGDNKVYIRRLEDTIPTITDLTSFKSYLSSNNLEVVYPLATPVTYQLTATEIKTLLGMNNVWADTGNITELKYWKE